MCFGWIFSGKMCDRTEKRQRISKNCKLFALKRLICLRQIAQKNINCFILLFCDDEQTYCPAIRQILSYPRPMLFYGVHAVADTGINRVLQHMISVCKQKIAKTRCLAALTFRLDRQIEENQDSHKPIHSNAVPTPKAAAGKEQHPFPTASGKDFVPSVPPHRKHCDAACQKECLNSGS